MISRACFCVHLSSTLVLSIVCNRRPTALCKIMRSQSVTAPIGFLFFISSPFFCFDQLSIILFLLCFYWPVRHQLPVSRCGLVTFDDSFLSHSPWARVACVFAVQLCLIACHGIFSKGQIYKYIYTAIQAVSGSSFQCIFVYLNPTSESINFGSPTWDVSVFVSSQSSYLSNSSNLDR